MSAEIKPGQVWKDATGPAHVRIDTVSNNRVSYTWMDDSTSPGLKGSRYVGEFLTDYTPAPSLPTQASNDDGRETAPLDPGAVKAGDTVTLDSDELEASVKGRVTDIQHDRGAWTIYLTLGVMGHSTPFTVGVGTSWTLTAHQPAAEPEPEWKPGTVALASVRGHGNVQVMRSHRTGSVASEFWLSDREVDGYLQHQDPHVTDVRPLVVIDPAAVDVDALATTLFESRHYGVELSSAGSHYLARVARTFFVGGEDR